MTTNKVVLKQVDEFMAGFSPIYKPIFPLLLEKNAIQHDAKVGKNAFRTLNAVGDIRGKHVTPKDTELHQVNSMESSKYFKKYFLMNQYKTSFLQDAEGFQDVVSQVLDEHNVQADELLLLGEGTSASTMINNGLYWSSDENYTLESSSAIASGDTRLSLLHTAMVASAQKADLLDGEKLMLVYGTSMLPYFDSLYASTQVPFKRALGEVLSGYDIAKLPADCTPSSANGWIIINKDQIRTHYTKIPELMAQGSNEEKMYNWANFIMGSFMVEVKAQHGIVRQPITFS